MYVTRRSYDYCLEGRQPLGCANFPLPGHRRYQLRFLGRGCTVWYVIFYDNVGSLPKSAKTNAFTVDYLLKPAGLRPARSGAAIAILVIYFLLLFFVACTYYRILYTLVINPGYVERGPQYYAVLEEKKHQVKGKRDRFRKSGKVHGAGDAEKGFATSYKGAAVGGRPNPSESVGLQDFYRKEVFVCEGDGRPVWCSMCMNWKPDRTHHCSEVNRCVRKMDHYCPWYVCPLLTFPNWVDGTND